MVIKVVVAWHNEKQIEKFIYAWKTHAADNRLVLQQDKNKEGCARTKNAGILRATDSGADVIIVLDDDCYPSDPNESAPLDALIEEHIEALAPQQVQMVVPTTVPHPRGYPYQDRTIPMQVAASIGLWTGYPDLDAMSALVLGPEPEQMTYLQSPLFNVMFPFCGMNFAYKPKVWSSCAVLIDVPRFDDIWMGWVWEKVAYEHGYCFNTNGPMVHHTRQSNVWNNLLEETKYLATNEALWSAIYMAPRGMTADDLRKQFGLDGKYGTE